MWELALLGLRMGTRPQAVVTTTPKPIAILRRLLDQPTTRLSRETTFANQLHLAPEFISEITSMYAGSRLGLQELMAEIVETSEAIRYPTFDPARHVTTRAEYLPGLPVRVAIDCGLSRHVGALWFQVRDRDAHRRILNVFADYSAVDKTSEVNALAILNRSREVCHGRLDAVYLDPASTARWGGPSGARRVCPGAGGADHDHLADSPGPRGAGPDRDPPGRPEPRTRPGHPSAVPVPDRVVPDLPAGGAARGDPRPPADPQHPAEEALDSLRGAVRVVYPEGRVEQPQFRTVPARSLF